ncbi:hypothetical protein 2 [Spheniscid alphaherpesvirus 1]|uniref:Uncharacterized protein n=1 Tax=Spheniscid alphaherpesvirus 1 TaxID=2560777 RepID=A0A1R3T522_9ALPH|nr:hypothetical protein 2 [Spheniscid alphaherpesvirus 1]
MEERGKAEASGYTCWTCWRKRRLSSQRKLQQKTIPQNTVTKRIPKMGFIVTVTTTVITTWHMVCVETIERPIKRSLGQVATKLAEQRSSGDLRSWNVEAKPWGWRRTCQNCTTKPT